MALLRTRKEAYKNQSEEGTWRDIYRLLFPDAADVPSSCKLKERSHIEALVHRSRGSKRKTPTKLDRVTDFDSGQYSSTPDPEGISGFENYMRREVPRLVQAQVEERIRQATSPLEESLFFAHL
jgi:hypothetical protein